MTNTNFQIGQEVTFSNAFGVNVITEIKGNTAKTIEKNTGITYTKRLTSLKAYVPQTAYWNEQEMAQPIYKHGDNVFSSLSLYGDSANMVWDEVKQDCVRKSELTNL
jgi:hypothetical protein